MGEVIVSGGMVDGEVVGVFLDVGTEWERVRRVVVCSDLPSK